MQSDLVSMIPRNLDSTPASALSAFWKAVGPAAAITVTSALVVLGAGCGALPDGEPERAAHPPVSRSGEASPDRLPLLTAAAEQGRNLFLNETFGGNGRTCATCHVLELNGGLPPSNVAARFATFKETFDPLFIAEKEMNLNTLTVRFNDPGAPVLFPAGAVLTGRGQGGRTVKAKVLTRLSQTRYLVYGGVNPRFAANTTITDGSRSARVASITAGDLDRLESPAKMRGRSTSADFPKGRALILENVEQEGFDGPHVFRKSPHLQNLRHTAPFGFSHLIFNLKQASVQAVQQHFPRRLARQEGVDFRLPTDEEQEQLKAFMESLVSVPGEAEDRFDLDHFARTAAQRRGRDLFQTDKGGCTNCHAGEVLEGPEKATGVANQAINAPAPGGDGLPSESPDQPFGGSTRPIGAPPLFNVKNNGPFFHDNSAATLEKAVSFYLTDTFRSAPDGQLIDPPPDLTPDEVGDVVAFISGLVARTYVVTSNGVDLTRKGRVLDLGSRDVGAGVVNQTLTVTNVGSSSIHFGTSPCRISSSRPEETPADFPAPDCSALAGITLPPNDSRDIVVRFDPASAGAKAAILEILAPDPTGVDLRGTGTGS
jgi:cytochrome c peroxidase